MTVGSTGRSIRSTGALLAAAGFLLISLESLGIRLSDAPTWEVAFWIGTFGFASMVALVRIRTGRLLPAVAIEAGPMMLVSGALQAASVMFFIASVNATAVANTVVILAAAPIVAALVAWAVIGERTPPQTWIAMAVVIGGILVVVSGSLGRGRLAGDLLAVAAIVAYSFNLTLWRRLPGLDRMTAVGLGGLVAALVAVVPADPLGIGPSSVLILAAFGGFSSPAGRVGVALATRHLPVSQVSLFGPIETVAAIAWAWMFLGEAPPGATVVGGAIVLVAVAYGTTFGLRQQQD